MILGSSPLKHTITSEIIIKQVILALKTRLQAEILHPRQNYRQKYVIYINLVILI